MTKIYICLAVFFTVVITSCSEDEEIREEKSTGANMVLIGNSFFRPYASNLEEVALDAGFENHQATVVFRGGDNGRPFNFWKDFESAEHAQIKAALDAGGVDFFGMTGGLLEENPTDGYRDWIAYALQKNPNVKVFISIPPMDFPADWDTRATENGFSTIEELYASFEGDMIHKTLVDQLRVEFPKTAIFTIPTGWATLDLAKMQQEDLLLDDITMFGSKESTIFTDDKGHQGQIVIEAGTLIWLHCLYDVDLSTNNYQTGFKTDLHAVAKQITDDHDPSYKK